MRRRAPALAALIAAAAMLASRQACGAPTADEARLLALANEERRIDGLPPLQWSEALADVARAHAVDMRARGAIAHESGLDDARLADRLARGGVRVTRAAENVGLAPDAETAHLALMDSPGHRSNLLDPGLEAAGIGVVSDARGLWIVQDLAALAPDWDAERTVREVTALVLTRSTSRGAWATRADAGLAQAMQSAAEQMARDDASFAHADLEAGTGCWMLAYTSADPRDIPADREPACASTRAGVGAAWARTPSHPLGAWFVAIALAP